MPQFLKVRLIILGVCAVLAILYVFAAFPFAVARHAYSAKRWHSLDAQVAAGKAADAEIGAANPAGVQPLAIACDRKITAGDPGSIAAWFGDVPADADRAPEGEIPKKVIITPGPDAHLAKTEMEWLSWEHESFFRDWEEILGESPDRWLRRVHDYRWYESDPTKVRYLAVSRIRDLTLSPSDGMPTRVSLFVRVLDLPSAATACEGTLVVPVQHRASEGYSGVSGIAASPVIALCSAGGRTLCDAVNKDYASR
jgi:hypothetical protein